MIIRKQISIVLILSSLLLVGFSFNSKDEFTLDTNKIQVYECLSADTIVNDFSSNKKAAKEKYDEAVVRVLGTVSNKAKNNKSFSLGTINTSADTKIKCSISDKALIENLVDISNGSSVNVYGKIDVGISGSIEILADKIELSEDNGLIEKTYCFKDGSVINKAKYYKRNLANEAITFYIPSEWKDVERNIVENGLGEIEGYQYNLNNISDMNDKEVIPECLFVMYFDNDLFLKNTSERGKTTEIEKAILKNILIDKHGEVSDKVIEDFSDKTIKTYYGASYNYYQNVFEDDDKKSYRTEFVFQPVEKKGIIVYLYLFKDNNHITHLNDVMSVLRFTEYKK